MHTQAQTFSSQTKQKQKCILLNRHTDALGRLSACPWIAVTVPVLVDEVAVGFRSHVSLVARVTAGRDADVIAYRGADNFSVIRRWWRPAQSDGFPAFFWPISFRTTVDDVKRLHFFQEIKFEGRVRDVTWRWHYLQGVATVGVMPLNHRAVSDVVVQLIGHPDDHPVHSALIQQSARLGSTDHLRSHRLHLTFSLIPIWRRIGQHMLF